MSMVVLSRNHRTQLGAAPRTFTDEPFGTSIEVAPDILLKVSIHLVSALIWVTSFAFCGLWNSVVWEVRDCRCLKSGCEDGTV